MEATLKKVKKNDRFTLPGLPGVFTVNRVTKDEVEFKGSDGEKRSFTIGSFQHQLAHFEPR